MPNELKPCPDKIYFREFSGGGFDIDYYPCPPHYVEYTRTDTALLTKLKGLRDELDKEAIKNSETKDKFNYGKSMEANIIAIKLTALIDSEPEQDVCEWVWNREGLCWLAKCGLEATDCMKYCPACGKPIKEVEG